MPAVETLVRELPQALQLKPKAVFAALRLGMSGQTVTPSFFESLWVLGCDNAGVPARAVGPLGSPEPHSAGSPAQRSPTSLTARVPLRRATSAPFRAQRTHKSPHKGTTLLSEEASREHGSGVRVMTTGPVYVVGAAGHTGGAALRRTVP